MKSENKIQVNNDNAIYNGYKAGLTVEWMCSMANISKSAAYKAISRVKEKLKKINP